VDPSVGYRLRLGSTITCPRNTVCPHSRLIARLASKHNRNSHLATLQPPQAPCILRLIAMTPPNSLQNKSSMFFLSQSKSPAPSKSLRPPTPPFSKPFTSPHGRHRTGFRALFNKIRDPLRDPQPSSSSLELASPPVISKPTKAFADSLTAQQLSNFLTWMLYYDIVEPPESPETWYQPISSIDIRGWISLGSFLTQSLEAECGYGLDLVVLDSICDRIHLSRSTVHMLLMQFSDPEKMKYSSIATTVQSAQRDGESNLGTLEAVQAKLHELAKLATHLRPQEGSQYDDWRAVTLKRIKEFLHCVVGPQIAHLKHGKPLLTAATSEHVPKEVRDAIQLNYLFEVVQQERAVPLARYGLISPSPRQVSSLLREKEKLLESNEKLAKTLAGLGNVQTDAYSRPPSPSCASEHSPFTLSSSTSSPPKKGKQSLFPPSTNRRPRSISGSAVPIHHPSSSPGLSSHHTLHRQHSALPLSKHEDVFSGLD
jgi:hypothetical protein